MSVCLKPTYLILPIDNAQDTGTPLQWGQDGNAMTALNDNDDDCQPQKKQSGSQGVLAWTWNLHGMLATFSLCSSGGRARHLHGMLAIFSLVT